MTLKNETTIEGFFRENPYDIGRRKNWEQTMGKNPWLWFMPVPTTQGNGLVYPTNLDLEDTGTSIV
eukprot:CAMPEP_0168524282 /NCGR_PEP_ID=MMETSP0405-20121227/10551_1 /TAXON_ID=498012 /ORGANISM="Trichosphaerium sp, Strain Am-I-7 wt" /LENGTH=65 /DNA_ID=CAMNT_0008546447 /DNA_START=279 /DNA_END=476 /DNA_ORIENTATION=-